MSDYMESLFQSVDILIDKRLEDLAYDTTVICTIIDSTDKKNGRYRVTDGSVSYIAYSDKDSFREGEQVRVNIPKGDFTQKKFIIGKYTADDNGSPITYVSPLDSIVNISGNLTSILGEREYGILANGPETKKILWNQRLDPDQFRDLQANGIYNTLIVKADFKTLLYNYNYVTGTYGLRVDLLVRPSPDSTVRMKRTVEFTSKEMFGNPYNFAVFSPQAKTFSVVSAGIIEGIELSLFQNGDFTNDKGQYVKAPSNMADNILIKNIELGFGSNLLDVEDNVVRIYSENDLFYKYMPHTEDTNRKKIGLVWYNKDENNKYVGFGDGIYDTLYDEMAYIIESTYDTRLLAQKGREDIPTDELGLKMAADIEDAIPILYRISSMLTQDLCSELNYFKDLTADSSNLSNLLENLKIELTMIARQLRDADQGELINKLENCYKSILKYVSDQINQVEEPVGKPAISNYFSSILQAINNNLSSSRDNCLQWVINTLKNFTTIDAGYQEIYDNCIIRVTRVVDKIQKVIDTLPENMESDYANISNYINNLDIENYIPYAEKDFSDMSNKYCIYWYRYEEGYEDESDALKLMPNGWRRLTADEIKNPLMGSYDYTGLPNKSSELSEDGKEVYESQSRGPESFVYPYMRNDQKQEKFVAVVCYNHAIYKSNELVFNNSQEIPDKNTLDKGDILQFEHVEGYGSTDSYLVYNDIYYLRDIADAHKQREIRCHYDGLLASDDALINARIYWYIPENSTMISYDKEFLIDKGFDTDEGLSLHYSKAGYVCFYKQIYGKRVGENLNFNIDQNGSVIGYDNRSFWYQIKEYYEPTAVKNHIICRVVPGGDFDGVESGQYFTFGIAGTNGTKYTLAITNNTSKCALESTGTPLKLNVVLKDANNASVPFQDTPKVEWYMHTVSAPYMSDEIKNNVISINAHDGCGILNASTEIDIGTDDEDRIVKLQYLYAVPWRGGNYYLSGPTYITYSNLGTLNGMSMFDNPYKLFNSITQQEETGITWSVEYIKVGSGNTTFTLDALPYPDRDYMPKLNNNNGLTPSPLYIENIEYIPIVIAKRGSLALWRQPIIITQNRYAFPLLNDWDGKFCINEENGTILSSMIGAGRKNVNSNTFDGVLMGNVALEASMTPVSNKNYGLENKSGIGIYGFHESVQSFGFNIDGTAFLGKSGRGRIIFNGDNGLIASANWFTGDPAKENSGGVIAEDGTIQRQSTAGMCLDLENGHIDAYNFRLTSKNIYLNSNPGWDPTADQLSNKYFMYIGNDSKGHISLDKDGKLEMRVNSFYLTGAIGGLNLLKQTSPRQLTPSTTNTHTYKAVTNSSQTGSESVTQTGSNVEVKNSIYDASGNITYTWTVDKWKGKATGSAGSGDKLYPLRLIGNETTYQDVILDSDEEYTISGWVNKASNLEIILNASNNIVYAKWDDLDRVLFTDSASKIYQSGNSFILNENDGAWHYFEITFKLAASATRISFKHAGDTLLWHLKLERGSVATAWSPAPEDTEENLTLTTNNLDLYLTQDKLFDKLFTDPISKQKMDGIILADEDQTLSGRKELFINATYISTGILRSKNWDGKIRATFNSTNSTYTLDTSVKPTKGMYINLDEGKIWSAKFELEAGSGDDNYIFLSSEDLASKKQLGSHTTSSFNHSAKNWRIIAGGNFGVTGDGTLFAKKGKVGGWTLHENKLYTGGRIDKVDSTLLPVCVQAPTKATSTVFAVGGKADHSDYQDEATRVFYVTAEGKLYAKNAEIEGKITAKSGKFGGWTMSSTMLYQDMYFVSDTDLTKTDLANAKCKYRTFMQAGNDITYSAFAVYKYTRSATSSDDTGWTTHHQFYVNHKGKLYAKNADIEGKITTKSGNIGGCTFTEGGTLQVKNANISSISSNKIKIGNTDTALFSYANGTITMNTAGGSGSGLSLNVDQFKIWGTTNNFIEFDAWTDDPHDGPYYGDYGMVIYSGSWGGKLSGNWYLDSGASVTSDENFKHSIQKLDLYNYDEFFNNLLPRRFKYNDGTSDRYHIGFISQEVEDSLTQSTLSSLDFAGFVYDPRNNKYYLRYEEFIALNTWQIQKLKTRIQELETRLSNLENK